jgi:pyruvate kinase
MSATKIVATIGPKTCDPKSLRALARAGMGMARLNGSHNTLEWHANAIRAIRQTLPAMPILLDIPGRKIRTGQLAVEPNFGKGDRIVLTTDSRHDGSKKVPVNSRTLHMDLKKGVTIFADDGTLRFTVVDLRDRDIICRAETPGTLRSAKGINVPGIRLRGNLVTARDRSMIDFARKNGIDFIGISFVESARHVAAIRKLTGGDWPRILSKVENRGGLDNVEEIVAASDAIMIDRGDLSVETSIERLAVFQKHIISAARGHAKPVVVATEMLHSMIENSFPTKAEVSDITNAVLDGGAATMLSGETAIGAHPVEAVRVMRKVSDAAAEHLQDMLDTHDDGARSELPEVMSEAIALVCRRLPITKIVAITKTGYAARTVAAGRPRQPILAVSDDAMAARSFNLYPGTEGIHVDVTFQRTSTDHIPRCIAALWRRGKLVDSDLILITAVGYPGSGQRMNLMQTHRVGDMARTLGWKRETRKRT